MNTALDFNRSESMRFKGVHHVEFSVLEYDESIKSSIRCLVGLGIKASGHSILIIDQPIIWRANIFIHVGSSGNDLG